MTSRHRDKNTKRKENYLINHRFSIAQKYDVNLALLIFYLNGTEKVKTRNKYIILIFAQHLHVRYQNKGSIAILRKNARDVYQGRCQLD